MNSNNTTVGIDVGTAHIKVVVTQNTKSKKGIFPRIIGTGISKSRGVRRGYIINTSEAQKSIKEAVQKAEKSSETKITRAFTSISGIGLQGVVTTGKTVVSGANMEVKEIDMKNSLETAESQIPPSASFNRRVVHAIPLEHKLDGQDILGNPLGLKGGSLETKTFFITCLEHHINDIVETIEGLGIEVIDTIASPIASNFVSLTKPQKIAGCVLADIGAETTSVVVFEDSIPISLEVFPIGGSDITNDLALGLKISLEEAERIKLSGISQTSVSQQKINNLTSIKIKKIFNAIDEHLKKINRNELLPAGIVISGGGSGLQDIEEKARLHLKLPSSVAYISSGNQKDLQRGDSRWMVAYGLCLIGMGEESERKLNIGNILKKSYRSLMSWMRQFMP